MINEFNDRGSVGPGVLLAGRVDGRQFTLRPSRDGQARRHPHPRQHPLLTFYPCLPFSPFSQSVIHKRSSVNPKDPHNNPLQAPQPAYLPRAPRASLPRVSEMRQSSWRDQNCPLKLNTYLQMRNSLPLIHATSILSPPMVRVPLLPNSRCLSAGNRPRWPPTT
jgi:hypothetical protein